MVSINKTFDNTTNQYNKTSYNLVTEVAVGMSIHTTSQDKTPNAIVGIRLPLATLTSILTNNTNKNSSFDCKKSNIFSCHFIDENAIIVANNQNDKEVGEFFGKINGIVMEKLIEISVYERKEFEEPHYKLKPSVKSGSNILQNTYQLLWKALHSFLLYIVTIAMELVSVYGTLTDDALEVVIKRHFIFVRSNKFISQSGSVPCNQSYAIRSIENTNLLLVVTKNNCNKTFNYAMRTDEEDRGHIHCPIKPRTAYRKSLSNCQKLTCNHPECGSETYTDESYHVEGNLIALGVMSFTTLLILGALPMLKKIFHFISLYINRKM